MDILENLKQFAETATTSFDIEPQLTGSIAVRNVPNYYAMLFEDAVKAYVKIENINAIRKLQANRVAFSRRVYALNIQSVNNPHTDTSSFRISIKYTGPFIQNKIVGVYNNRADLSVWAQGMIARVVKELVAKRPLKETRPDKDGKEVTISYQSRYAQLIGCYQGEFMKIRVTPTRTDYTNLIKDNMPETINNIAIKLVQVAPSVLLYSMHAAGLPYLKRIGAIIDAAVASRANH